MYHQGAHTDDVVAILFVISATYAGSVVVILRRYQFALRRACGLRVDGEFMVCALKSHATRTSQ